MNPKPLSAERGGCCLKRFVRHILVIEEPHRGKWQRSDSWKPKDRRELADWEWRLLFQLSRLDPTRRAEIAISIAEEWIRGTVKNLTLPDELKEKTIGVILEQARMDNEPNDQALRPGETETKP